MIWKCFLLLDIFLNDRLYVPLLGRLECLDVGGFAVLLQGGGGAPGLDHGPLVVSTRLPVQIIMDTSSLRLCRLYHGPRVPEEALLVLHSEVSVDPHFRHCMDMEKWILCDATCQVVTLITSLDTTHFVTPH